MIGLAFGTIYYPVFLLPLWISFYWQRGLWRFLIGMLTMVGVLVLALTFTSSDVPMFVTGLEQMFGWRFPMGEDMSGAWGQFWRPEYRYPILAAHVGLSLSLALWPAHKNLGTLVSYSAVMMLCTQFWHAHSGGLALAWYLPLMLLTVFRPNLEDRMALAVVKQLR
jgi:peptidoglycan/LPS O-acetylase OafA/YrhL